MYRFSLAFAALLALLSACQESKPKLDHGGNIYYFAKFEEHNRMALGDGEYTVLTCALEHTPAPKGAKDGDKGANLHISFLKPELLKKGASYDIPHPDINVVLAEWGAPAYFNLNRNLSGTLQIIDNIPFQAATITVDLKVRTGLDQFKTFLLERNQFVCNRHHRRYMGGALELESFDSSFDAEKLSAANLEGTWKKVGEIYYDQSFQSWEEIFFFPQEVIWEINSGQFKKPAYKSLSVANRRLQFTDEAGKTMVFSINSLSKDQLIVTDLVTNTKNRYIFARK